MAEQDATAQAQGAEAGAINQQPDGQGEQQGGQQSGGLLRSHAEGGGESSEGQQPAETGDEASSSDDGRPLIQLDDGTQKPLPDQFWDADNKQVRADALFKAFSDTKSGYDKLVNEKKTLEEQLQQGKQGQGQVPESPEGYEFQQPEGLNRDVPADDPLLTQFKQVAHKNGIDQETFNAVAGEFLTNIEEQVGPPVDMNAEREKLGPNADTLLQTTARWVDGLVDDGILSQSERDEVLAIGETAEGVKALNKIRERMGEKPIPTEGAKVSELPSKEELYSMVGTEKYRNDPEHRQYVDDLFKRVFGDQPAGTSQPGIGIGGG